MTASLLDKVILEGPSLRAWAVTRVTSYPAAALAGLIWAIGFPFLVTRIGLPVRSTFARTARQVALNCTIDTSSTKQGTPSVVNEHRQLLFPSTGSDAGSGSGGS